MSLAEWKEREKEQRRNDIIDVAMKLFYSNGYDNVSMSDIAEKVGLKKPTLYLYFTNKEALFYAIVIRGSRMRIAIAREDLGDCTKSNKGYILVVRSISRFSKEYPEYAWADAFFRSGRFDLGDTANEDIVKILDLQGKVFDIIGVYLASCMRDGTIPSDVDPLAAAVWIAAVTESTDNLRPDYRHVLKRGGIDQEAFAADTALLMKRAILNGHKASNRDLP
jgi:TetR/AcrR family transcriptional regulator